MTQIDPRTPKATTRTAEVGGPPRKQEPPFNWRVSVGMAIGLLVLFGVLFGLRALDIFPPKPAEDPQIAAARATLAAVPTLQAVAAVQPTKASTQAPAPATSGPVVVSTPAQTNETLAAATPPPVQTRAPALGRTQQPGTIAPAPAAAGAQFETEPTPVAATESDHANPAVTTPINSTPAEATPP